MQIGESREVHEWFGMHGDKLPPPDALVYYPDGSFLPMMLHFAAESCIAADIAREHGFELRTVNMLDAMPDDDPLCVAYADGCGEAMKRWMPPYLDGWSLVGKYDTEDGPAALYARKRPDTQ